MKRFFLLFVLLLTLGASAYAQVMYKCTGDRVRVRMGPGTNYAVAVSDGGLRNPFGYGTTVYLYKGDVLQYAGAKKNGFVKVYVNWDIPIFSNSAGTPNLGWVSAQYLKRVTTCTVCKGSGRKGTCPECHGEGWGYCCLYTGLKSCKTCGGDGVR